MTLRQKRAFFAEGQGFLEAAPKDRKDEARRAFFFLSFQRCPQLFSVTRGGGATGMIFCTYEMMTLRK